MVFLNNNPDVILNKSENPTKNKLENIWTLYFVLLVNSDHKRRNIDTELKKRIES